MQKRDALTKGMSNWHRFNYQESMNILERAKRGEIEKEKKGNKVLSFEEFLRLVSHGGHEF